MRPTRPLYFMLNLAGSGHDFRGVCFSVAYTTPNGKSCRAFPQIRSIYHNSRCTYPLKRHQSLSDAKNAKRQGNTRVNIKNASESFLARCITMHESDARSVSCVLNTERLKTKSFLPPDGRFCPEIFCFRASRFARTKKNRPRVGARIRVCEKFFLVVECVNVRNRPKIP